jgi:hypothetical protein
MRRIWRTLWVAWSALAIAGFAAAGGVADASTGAAAAARPLAAQVRGVWCTSATSCMAVGGAGGPNFNAGLLADRWNGVTWSVVSVPKPPGALSGELTSVSCTSPSACTAVGSWGNSHVQAPLAERWNGTAWTVEKIPPGNATAPYLFGTACATTTSCAAVGCNLDGDFCSAAVAYEWNGTAWRPEPTPAGGQRLNSVSCSAPAACMAVGEGSKGTLSERWNGRAWSIVPSPNPKNGQLLQLDGVSCLAAGCEAVGSYANKLGAIVTLAERWNGRTWSIQHSPNPPGALTGLGGVSCSAADACTAVGSYDNSTGQTLTTALRWDGTAWAVQAPANPRTRPFVVVTLSAVSCPAAASCTTVGYNVFGSEGATRALAEGWNGTSWAIEPTPEPGITAYRRLSR